MGEVQADPVEPETREPVERPSVEAGEPVDRQSLDRPLPPAPRRDPPPSAPGGDPPPPEPPPPRSGEFTPDPAP